MLKLARGRGQTVSVELLVLLLTIVTGCSSLTPRQKGALTGGATGAGTGMLFAGPVGAVVGGTVGAIGGSMNAAKESTAHEQAKVHAR